MREKVLELREIYFSYMDKKILENINFSVFKGECLSLFGPNGSGKSTLIKIILGILKPQKGDVLYKNVSIFKINERERGRIFSYVPQRINVYFPLSTFDYLLLGRAPYINGFVKREDKEIVLNLMEKFKILQLKNINFQLLSEGEKQLITLIRAVIQESEIIVLDEPLTHLDLKYKSKILNLLKELKNQGKTIITVFHDIESIKFLSDKIVFIKSGHIEKYGNIENLINKEDIKSLFEEEITFNI